MSVKDKWVYSTTNVDYCLYNINTDNKSCFWRMLLISWILLFRIVYTYMFTIEIKLLSTIQENIK